ncbi:ABC transporter permease [Bosea sp. RAF48]|uniref:ABC transporter permease n=1 Tax=Bosea sp. RAF48 TaxID=3237480 RepID=UPI003F93B8B3
MRVAGVFGRALIRAAPTMLGIVVLSFFLLKLVPGDLVDVLTAESGAATEEGVALWRRQFGLDLPLLAQFLVYLGNLAQFSLGTSPRFGVPVSELILERLPGTLALMGVSLAIAVGLGVVLGSAMAARRGSWPDRVLSVISIFFYSVPSFWIGLMMIVLFSVKLGWLPSGGDRTIASGLSGVSLALDRVKYMMMPCLSLSLFYVAIYARLMRASMLDVARQDYLRTAQAKGVPQRTVLFTHALRNALLPVTTVAGVHFGGILGGAVVVETIYAWPGLGRLAFESVMARDFNVMLGILVLSSVLVTFANVLADVTQAWLDPRVEIG